MSKINQLKDPGAERVLLASILRGGKDAYIDIEGLVDSTDFTLPINRTIFSCLQHLAEDITCEKFDIESVKLKANSLGVGEIFNDKKVLEYIDLLEYVDYHKENLQLFAYQIKKYSIIRDLYQRYQDASKYIENITGKEDLSEVIAKAEDKIVDFINGIDSGDNLQSIVQDIENRVVRLIEDEPVDEIGLPLGFPLFEEAIGGGPRRGTVSIIGARPKSAKSFLGMNFAYNVMKRNKIPILYLDTELTKDVQQIRLLSIASGCPLYKTETGKFKYDENFVNAIIDASKEIKDMPFYYQSIAGMSHTEALALARRWIVKHVGFNSDGKAKDCLIIYDYIKLVSSEGITKNMAEYALLGFLLTDLHNFAVKYDVPFIGFAQLNRDGIDGEDTSVLAASDRITWLASSLTLLKNKNENDIGLGCGYDKGNKKLIPCVTRFGAGLDKYGDYINIRASLSPGINKDEANGIITEGLLFSQVCSGPPTNEKNKSGNNQ